MPDYQNKKTLRVKIDKLVHGGQGIGTLSDGRKAFVWNALPGEEVNFFPFFVFDYFISKY